MTTPSRALGPLPRIGFFAIAAVTCLALPALAQNQAPASPPQAPLAAKPVIPFHADVRRHEPGRTTAPVVVRSVMPRYTPEALRRKISGRVGLEILIDTEGAVTDARLVRSLDERDGLDEEALKAARRWTFTPARDESGVPMPIVVQLDLDFTIRR